MKRAGLLLPFLTLILNAQTVTSQQKHTITPEDMVNIRSVYDANVSPDGKRVAFVVSEPGDPNKPANARDENIWIVPTDGSEPAHLFASSPKRESFPRWSPDGRWLAFLSDRGEDGRAQIWLIRADGGEAEKLTDAKAGVSSFRWSPDGRMVAFLARDAKTEEEQKKQERRDDPIYVDHDDKYNRLWLVDLNDRKSTLVTRHDIEVVGFDWSPDATSFAIGFTSVPGFLKDGNLQLAVVRRSNGELLKTLSENVSIFNTNIRWSPDDTTLLFFEGSPRRGAHWFRLLTLRVGGCGLS